MDEEGNDFRDILNSMYEDMKVRIELGFVQMDDAEEFQKQLWEAIAEKMPEDIPDVEYGLNTFSLVFGTLCERILREHFNEKGGDWW